MLISHIFEAKITVKNRIVHNIKKCLFQRLIISPLSQHVKSCGCISFAGWEKWCALGYADRSKFLVTLLLRTLPLPLPLTNLNPKEPTPNLNPKLRCTCNRCHSDYSPLWREFRTCIYLFHTGIELISHWWPSSVCPIVSQIHPTIDSYNLLLVTHT